MNHTTVRDAVARPVGLAATAVTAALLVAGPAAAADQAPSRVTARPSADELAPGQEFVLRGRLTSEGEPVVGAAVRVGSYDGTAGTWSALPGARVSTDSEGRYRVRVVLHQPGGRLLRVVANPHGDDIATARRIVSVIVG